MLFTNEQKLSLLSGLQYYEKLNRQYYILHSDVNDESFVPFIYCVYYYHKNRKKTKIVLPFYAYVIVSDTKPNTYKILLCLKNKGTILTADCVPYNLVKAYVDDLYGAANRACIKANDGRNAASSLAYEIERLQHFMYDKFQYAKWWFNEKLIDEVKDDDYKIDIES